MGFCHVQMGFVHVQMGIVHVQMGIVRVQMGKVHVFVGVWLILKHTHAIIATTKDTFEEKIKLIWK